MKQVIIPGPEHMDFKDYTFANCATTELTEDELAECSELYSTQYGVWGSDDSREGNPVRMSVNHYRTNYCVPDYFIATARDNGKLIGQALYLRVRVEDYGIMTWVVQLVVNRQYRHRGIASTLLRSVWGFSDDYAWGLATANPCTVKTLESATFRKCKPNVVNGHLSEIIKLGRKVPFVEENEFEVSDEKSQVNSHFSVDNSEYGNVEEISRRLGKLLPGREWLAFTFRDQPINQELYKKKFSEMVSFSESALKDAYSRMRISEQGWAKNTSKKTGYIETNYITEIKTSKILDLGCGIGRHSLDFAQKGARVTGVDFSTNNIKTAKEEAKKLQLDNEVEFIESDIRYFSTDDRYDLVLCLYDVIGSFPDEEDNRRIISKAYEHLNKGGYFICSVMNMELTESLIYEKNKAVLREHPEILQKLPPGNIMQSTGQIFDPEYLAYDEESGLIFRKEQFSYDKSLPCEYVIRDKRYKTDEIKKLIENEGFSVKHISYVRSGEFDKNLSSTDPKAKEILIAAQK